VRLPLWQYQRLAQPLEPTLTRTPEMSTWYVQPSEPKRTVAPRPYAGLTFVAPAPDAIPPPDVCLWMFWPPQAPLLRRQAPQGWFCWPLEPTLLTAVADLRWFAPASTPVRKAPLRLPGWWTGVLEPTLLTAVADLRWFAPASTPVRKAPLRLPGWWTGVLEPTLLRTPEMASWWQRISEPVLPRKRPPPSDEFGPVYVQPITVDMWWQRTSEPVRRPMRPVTTGAYVADPVTYNTGAPSCPGPSRRPDNEDMLRPRMPEIEEEYRWRGTNRRTQRGA
jgi:hypothetical protein